MDIERTTPTEDNPDGLLFVPEAEAMHLGKARSPSSGVGAVGSVIAGPIVAFVTKGGSKPLPEWTTEESAGTHLQEVIDSKRDIISNKLTKASIELAQLRAKMSGRYGRLFRSAVEDEQTEIIFQTIGVSPDNPCLIEFEQFILDPFTGAGQFDLVERDSMRRVFDGVSAGGTPVLGSDTMNWQPSDEGKFIKVGMNPGRYYTILSVDAPDEVTLNNNITLLSSELTLTMEGEIETTIATKNGFPGVTPIDGWSPLSKLITSDKVYLGVFVPGDTGDGVFLINARAVYHTDPMPKQEQE